MQNYAHRVPVNNTMFTRGRDLINNMCQQHNKVLPVRCDLHFPSGHFHDGSNLEIQNLHKRLKQYFSYHRTDMCYFTVREINNSPVPHFHLFLLVDGNKHQSPHRIWVIVERIWNNILGYAGSGLVHRCYEITGDIPVQGLAMMRRPSMLATGVELERQQEAFNRACYTALGHLEYLAKSATKEQAGCKNRRFFVSQF